MTLTQIAASVATAGFAGLAGFQLLLALGAPLGHFAWGGFHERLPAPLRLGSLLAVVLLSFGAVCVLEQAGLICVVRHPTGVRAAVWGLTGLFGLSTVGNLASRSTSERRVGTPIALVLAVACLVVALRP